MKIPMRRWMIALTGLASVASGFQSDNSTLTRGFNQTVALTNTPITVTANFSNAELVTLRGFSFSEQLPANLLVQPVSVKLNGRIVTNYIFETGINGDVYPECIPYRWVLEEPTDFAEANPIPASTAVQIVYSVSSPVSGAFEASQFSWSGFDSLGTNACFGFSESADRQMLTFMTPADRALLTGRIVSNNFVLDLIAVPGNVYVVEVSSNLVAWTSIATNTAPFTFVGNPASSSVRWFYRARWKP
jgi:hypothetical protein